MVKINYKYFIDFYIGFHGLKYKKITLPNLALLQWRVVDVAAQCGLITIARRTRQTSSDKSATASNAGPSCVILKKRSTEH